MLTVSEKLLIRFQEEEDPGPGSVCTKIYPVHNRSDLEGFKFINELKIIQASQN